MNDQIGAWLRRFGLHRFARIAKDLVVPERRNELGRAWAIRRRLGRQWQRALNRRPTQASALVVGTFRVTDAMMQAPLIAALRLAGYRPLVLLNERNLALQSVYRRLGSSGFVFFEDHLAPNGTPAAGPAANVIDSAEALLGITYKGASVGKYALSTLMRWTRSGDPDLSEPSVRARAGEALSTAVRYTDAAARIVAAHRPALALFNDHGYTPSGQLFDLVLGDGGACMTWNASHRDGALMLKRYGLENRGIHPATLSEESWTWLKAMPWSDRHWQELRQELEFCYRSGQWYGEVGTQFRKVFPERAELIARLGLDPAKKTAAVFAHIFWDATFFWGRDLYRNYEDWFIQTVKAACANPALNWLIKIHPANVTKDSRDGYRGEHNEIVAIREAIGTLPDHVKLLTADTEISTLALFDIVDFCLTVRGTTGLESACFGAQTITAGTGRYDRLGFTVDPQSCEEHLGLIARLETLPPPSPAATELARRCAYGLLLARPTPLSTVRFGFRQDAAASLTVELNLPPDRDPGRAADLGAIADWMAGGKEDFLSFAPRG